MDHLAAGGTDVERVKREVGVTDELLRQYNYSTNLEEYRQNNRRIAAPLFQPCVAKLNQTANQADDLELLDVLFVEDDMPRGVNRVHMHFRAMRKTSGSNAETLDNCLDAARHNAKTLGEFLALPDEVDYKEIKR